MLKIISGDGKAAVIAAKGTVTDIVVELGEAIAAIHSQFCRSSPMDATIFQAAVKCMVSDPDTPLWDGAVEAAFGMAMVVPEKEGGV